MSRISYVRNFQTELSIATKGRAWTSSDGIRGPENSAIDPTFANWPGPVDFLTDPSFITESGLGRFIGAKKLSGSVRHLLSPVSLSKSRPAAVCCAAPGVL